jgi:hypothetical protein
MRGTRSSMGLRSEGARSDGGQGDRTAVDGVFGYAFSHYPWAEVYILNVILPIQRLSGLSSHHQKAPPFTNPYIHIHPRK